MSSPAQQRGEPPRPGGGTPADGDRPRTRTRLKGAPVAAPSSGAPPKTIGRYTIEGVIGRGAMGVVYKARDPLLDRVVAVKTILAPPGFGASVQKAYCERFQREAKAAARISHPAIVTIYDVGLDGEQPFLVMEYLPGETLADRLDRTRMSLSEAVSCARDLAAALALAHREQIVHRDVKPANVISAGEGRWKLTDFGIARLPGSDLTQIGAFLGTPGYAPPEAIREGRYTPQADVFAWGAVLYELVCGKVPYEGPDATTTNGYVLKAEAPSPTTVDPTVPPALAEIAVRALSHDPGRRFADCASAETALAEAWSSISSSVTPAPVVAAPASASAPATVADRSQPMTIVASKDREDPSDSTDPTTIYRSISSDPARPTTGSMPGKSAATAFDAEPQSRFGFWLTIAILSLIAAGIGYFFAQQGGG